MFLNPLVDLKTAGVFRTSTGKGAEWIRNGGVIKFGRQEVWAGVYCKPALRAIVQYDFPL